MDRAHGMVEELKIAGSTNGKRNLALTIADCWCGKLAKCFDLRLASNSVVGVKKVRKFNLFS